jgi:hypothetical protein
MKQELLTVKELPAEPSYEREVDSTRVLHVGNIRWLCRMARFDLANEPWKGTGEAAPSKTPSVSFYSRRQRTLKNVSLFSI